MRWFHHDEGIDSPEVYLRDGPGEAELMSREEALAIARSRGLHLIPEWPEQQTAGPSSCLIGALSLPVGWEQVPEAEQAEEPDPLLWFEAPCGGRDLLAGNGNTFPGRMSAWCPDQQVSYNVSLAEMGQMSQQARYYVAGFLAGNQPGPPPAAGPRRRHRPRRPRRMESRRRQVPPHRRVVRPVAHVPGLRSRPAPRHRRRQLPGAPPEPAPINGILAVWKAGLTSIRWPG